MRLVAFAQMFNEKSTGNLRRCLDNVKCWADDIVIYDDCSDDGSIDIYPEYTQHVIRGDKNRFKDELFIKQEVFEYIRNNLKADWVLRIDADMIFNRRATDTLLLHELMFTAESMGIDGFMFRKINCYLSPVWQRVDNDYDYLYKNPHIYMWKVADYIKYNPSTGLHQLQSPDGIRHPVLVDSACFLHFGFASVEAIERKYRMYRSHGQEGWSLERLIDTNGMVLQRIPNEEFPTGFTPPDDPKPDEYDFSYLRDENDT